MEVLQWDYMDDASPSSSAATSWTEVRGSPQAQPQDSLKIAETAVRATVFVLIHCQEVYPNLIMVCLENLQETRGWEPLDGVFTLK